MVFLKHRVSGLGNDSDDGGLFRIQLTSLIDVMIFMIIFLIKSFSVEGDIITPSKDLELPVSTSTLPPKPSLSIEISRTEIISDGRILAEVPSVVSGGEMLIPGVFDWVKRQKAMIVDTAAGREVLIQADRDIRFDILKRVMYSCSKAGLSDFIVLAVQEE